jgi:hypothetical protein
MQRATKMDSPVDNVDFTSPYQGSDQVSPLHRSERDKERKFARALKEKLEEDLEKRKKRDKQDALVLERRPDIDKPHVLDKPDEETESTARAADVDDDEDQEPQSSEHIDLRA